MTPNAIINLADKLEAAKGVKITHVLQYRVPNSSNSLGADKTISTHFMINDTEEVASFVESFARPFVFSSPRVWSPDVVKDHVKIDLADYRSKD